MTDKIAKYVIIALGGMFAAAIFSFFWGNAEMKRHAEMRKHPVKFSYLKGPNTVYVGFVADNKECMLKIKDYYDSSLAGWDIFLPKCQYNGIGYNDSVFVEYLDADSVHAWVTVVYYRSTSPNAIMREFSGYALRSTLHDKPYKDTQ